LLLYVFQRSDAIDTLGDVLQQARVAWHNERLLFLGRSISSFLYFLLLLLLRLFLFTLFVRLLLILVFL